MLLRRFSHGSMEAQLATRACQIRDPGVPGSSFSSALIRAQECGYYSRFGCALPRGSRSFCDSHHSDHLCWTLESKRISRISVLWHERLLWDLHKRTFKIIEWCSVKKRCRNSDDFTKLSTRIAFEFKGLISKSVNLAGLGYCALRQCTIQTLHSQSKQCIRIGQKFSLKQVKATFRLVVIVK